MQDLARLGADLRLGQRATALDVAGGQVRLGLRAALLTGPRVVVVGAGLLGTEVAAAARTMGLEVTVVEPEPVPVRRPFGDRIGALVADLHRDHGTRLRCGTAWSATRCAGPYPASTPPETSPPGTTRTSAPACDWNTA